MTACAAELGSNEVCQPTGRERLIHSPRDHSNLHDLLALADMKLWGSYQSSRRPAPVGPEHVAVTNLELGYLMRFLDPPHHANSPLRHSWDVENLIYNWITFNVFDTF